MFNCVNITTNVNGLPILRTGGVTVGTDSVDFALGFRRIPQMGLFVINIADAIPDGTTATLPIRFTLNGNTRSLTQFGGADVTVADLTGTGAVLVFYNWYSGTLQLVSPGTPTA